MSIFKHPQVSWKQGAGDIELCHRGFWRVPTKKALEDDLDLSR